MYHFLTYSIFSSLCILQKLINADTLYLEAEIDQLVYQLYGLTEKEIAIIEESCKQK